MRVKKVLIEGKMYSSRFLRAFEQLMRREGGYSNNPNDCGSETKYGVSR
jgi:lysozyme family protein